MTASRTADGLPAIPLPSVTTADVIRYWASVRPDHPALRSAAGTLTYRELDERANRVAQALRAAGVGPEDRVAFLDKNSPEQAELFFGAAKLNAVPAPVNYRLAPPEVAHIVRDAEAVVLVVGEEFVPGIRKVVDELAGCRILVVGRAEGLESYDAWRDAHPAEDPGVAQGRDDVAYQLYSSGTTGLPKGVQITQANLGVSRSLYPWLMGLGPDSVNLVAMPLYHIGGGGWLYAGLAAGATNVLVREIDPSALAELLESERISIGFLVPAVLQFLLGVPGIGDRDFSALRNLLYGASPISEDVLARSIRTFGCDFVQAYGLTETTGSVVALPAEDHHLEGPLVGRLRAAGVAIPGAAIRIVDPATFVDVEQGEVGEIWIRSPQVMRGYWKRPEDTEAAMRPGGWFRSGDAGYLDEYGYLYLFDRVKDMIVSGAENIYPAEVENALMSHPAVDDAAVIGVPHERWGETPKALVVRAAGDGSAEVTGDQLIAYCRERLAGYKCPTSVDFIEAIPRNPSGKVLKKDLRAPFWEGHGRMVG